VGFGLALVAISVIGLWPHRKLYALFVLAVILAWIFLPSGIKPPQVGTLVYEKESAYNYIQVVQEGTRTELILNEGEAIHSIYDSQSLVTGGPWDYMVIANSFRPAQASEPVPKDVAILGLAGGTAARQYTAAFGDQVQITGVEIDPAILDVAHRFFHLDQPNVHPVVADARYWLDTHPGKYDVIALDAYQQPYIPFHLTTREFFSGVRDHLSPGGVVVANVGRTTTDYRLVDAIASTMSAVYPSVFLIDVPQFTNTMVYGSTEPTTLADVEHNLGLISEPLAKDVASSAIGAGRLRVSQYHSRVFTDDLAPVERLIDEIIFSYATGG
jgi:spermidine synthase